MWQSYLPSATTGHTCHMHFLWYSATAHHLPMGLFSTSVYSFFRRAIFITNPALPSSFGISLHFLFSSAFIHTLHSMAGSRLVVQSVSWDTQSTLCTPATFPSEGPQKKRGEMRIQRWMFSSIAVHTCCDPGSVCLAVPCLEHNAVRKICIPYGPVVSEQVSPLSPLWYCSGDTKNGSFWLIQSAVFWCWFVSTVLNSDGEVDITLNVLKVHK